MKNDADVSKMRRHVKIEKIINLIRASDHRNGIKHFIAPEYMRGLQEADDDLLDYKIKIWSK